MNIHKQICVYLSGKIDRYAFISVNLSVCIYKYCVGPPTILTNWPSLSKPLTALKATRFFPGINCTFARPVPSVVLDFVYTASTAFRLNLKRGKVSVWGGGFELHPRQLAE